MSELITVADPGALAPLTPKVEDPDYILGPNLHLFYTQIKQKNITYQMTYFAKNL